MCYKRNNHQGVGAVEAVLMLVVIGILGFTGWFVWQSQNKTNETLDAANNSEKAATTNKTQTTEQASDQDTTKYLVVEEWGVKFVLPETLYDSSVSYARNAQSSSDMLEFTTKKLTDIGCKFGAYGSDAVWRDSVSHDGEVDTIPLNDGKPIGGNYYYVVGARSSCASNQADSASETPQRNALQEMFKTIREN